MALVKITGARAVHEAPTLSPGGNPRNCGPVARVRRGGCDDHDLGQNWRIHSRYLPINPCRRSGVKADAIPRAPKEPKLGKKEQLLKDAETARHSGGWGELVH